MLQGIVESHRFFVNPTQTVSNINYSYLKPWYNAICRGGEIDYGSFFYVHSFVHSYVHNSRMLRDALSNKNDHIECLLNFNAPIDSTKHATIAG